MKLSKNMVAIFLIIAFICLYLQGSVASLVLGAVGTGLICLSAIIIILLK